MKKIILVALLFLAGIQAKAGKSVGNGGDAVVCYTDATRKTITSVKLFDYWEQEHASSYGPFDLGAPTLSVQEKIEIAVSRIAKFDPYLATKIKNISMGIANNIQSYLVTNYILPEIEDMNPKFVPMQPNCFIEQFAVQYKDVITSQRRFYISENFYKHINTTNDHRAGLILHEAIYRSAIITSNINNSDGVRLFNYYISTQTFMNLKNIDSYIKMTIQAGLMPTECLLKDGLYLKQSSIFLISCFNQQAIFGRTKIYVDAGSEIFYFTSSPGFKFIGAVNNFYKVTLENVSGVSETYRTRSEILVEGSNIKLTSLERDLNISYPIVYGPLNKYYKCNYSFGINFLTNEISSCDFYESKTNFYNFSPNNDGTWSISLNGYTVGVSLLELNVLGSNKGLKLNVRSGFNDKKNYQKIIVDNQLNLISGIVRDDVPQMSVNINGHPHSIAFFDVTKVDGKFSLNFTTSRQMYKFPRVRNLRIIDSQSNDVRAGAVFCKLQGLDEGYQNLSKTEFIGIQAEQFYDLATQSVVYKTDEDVTVLENIVCLAKNFTTQDY